MNEEKKTKKGGISVNRKSVEEAINRIRSLKQEKWSMEDLAEEMGVNRSTIYNLLNGEKASPDTLIKFSLYTKVCLDQLIAEKADVAKVKKKIIIDCIDRINEREQKEIQALWDLLLPYIKRSFLSEVSGKGDKGINTPFELLMILLKEEHGNLREELEGWIREYASREYLVLKKVLISLREMVGNLYFNDKMKRSA